MKRRDATQEGGNAESVSQERTSTGNSKLGSHRLSSKPGERERESSTREQSFHAMPPRDARLQRNKHVPVQREHRGHPERGEAVGHVHGVGALRRRLHARGELGHHGEQLGPAGEFVVLVMFLRRF